MKLCILGCGRSGTVYTTRLLNEVGIQVKHELEGKDGSVGAIRWKGQVLDISIYDNVIHQVREPVKVISSLQASNPQTFGKYARMMGYPGMKLCGNKIEQATMAWLVYTNWADRVSEWWYRVEDMENAWPRILGYYNKQHAIPDVPKDINHRNHPVLNMEDIERVSRSLAELVKIKGVQYGYYNDQGESK